LGALEITSSSTAIPLRFYLHFNNKYNTVTQRRRPRTATSIPSPGRHPHVPCRKRHDLCRHPHGLCGNPGDPAHGLSLQFGLPSFRTLCATICLAGASNRFHSGNNLNRLSNNFFYYQNVSADYTFITEFFYELVRQETESVVSCSTASSFAASARLLCLRHLRNQVRPLCTGNWTFLQLPVANSFAKVFGDLSSPCVKASAQRDGRKHRTAP
jgi:hypothetical protein